MGISFSFISIIILSALVYFILNYNVLKNTPLIDIRINKNNHLNASSVVCHTDYSSRICEFRNIYYKVSSKEFVFIRDDNSTAEGLNKFKDFGNEGFVEFSPIIGHNLMSFTFVELPIQDADIFVDNLSHLRIIKDRSILFKKFVSDNLMHEFHDDILPLYDRLRLLSEKFPSHIQLVEIQDLPILSYPYSDHITDYIYKILSIKKILKLNDFSNTEILCFKSLSVGLSNRTLWYQYGFGPYGGQGAIPDSEIKLYHGPDVDQCTKEGSRYREIARIINSSTSDFRRLSPKIDEQLLWSTSLIHVVIFVRHLNRIIINLAEIQQMISREFAVKLTTISLETHSLPVVIEHVASADVLIGMHGAALVTSMFMKKGSVLIELFPYLVDPSYITPYRTLASIMSLKYRVVTCTRKLDSRVHMKYMKGIANWQNIAEDNTMLGPVKCCNQAKWIFRAYQDTRIDTSKLLVTMKEVLRDYDTTRESNPSPTTRENASPTTHSLNNLYPTPAIPTTSTTTSSSTPRTSTITTTAFPTTTTSSTSRPVDEVSEEERNSHLPDNRITSEIRVSAVVHLKCTRISPNEGAALVRFSATWRPPTNQRPCVGVGGACVDVGYEMRLKCSNAQLEDEEDGYEGDARVKARYGLKTTQLNFDLADSSTCAPQIWVRRHDRHATGVFNKSPVSCV